MSLTVRLLGGFQVLYHGQPLTGVQSHQVGSLLAYLILKRAAPQPRQRLAFLLWPDTLEDQARTNLRKAIHFLRQALPAPDDYLISQGTHLQWNEHAPMTLDVAQFESAIETGDLEQAISLYCGDLLPDHYEEWVIMERERLHQAYLAALAQLVREKEQHKDYPSALQYARQLLVDDPLREEIHRCIMRLHVLNGDRAAALSAYQTCVQVLQRELGVEPAQFTLQLYQNLMEQKELPPENPGQPPTSTPFNNLPIQSTPFIGRSAELLALKTRISENRLVTITGAGGIGKSRLSIKTAAALLPCFPDGVCLVELVSIQDAHLLAKTVAAALVLHEVPGWSNQELLKRHLKKMRMLLVLDNCEHLLDACHQLVQFLLNGCPQVSILATSREDLGVPGEFIYRLLPISLPDPATSLQFKGDALLQFDAIRLFMDRAGQAVPGFTWTEENASTIAHICQRLDGIPLALELAAARLAILSPPEIAARLDHCFQLLVTPTRAGLPRHQTLRALIDWSYQLLDEKECTLLRRLAIFAGSFNLKAVEAICASEGLAESDILDLIHRLEKKSLMVIKRRTNQEVRYGLLESIRQYGIEKLHEAGEYDQLCHERLVYFTGFMRNIAPRLSGAEQAIWAHRLYLDEDNLLASLDWGFAHDINAALQLVVLFNDYQANVGVSSEYFNRLCRLMAQPQASAPTGLRASVLNGLGLLAKLIGDHITAARLLSEALSILRAIGSHAPDERATLVKVLRMLAPELSLTGHRQEGQALAKESVALVREAGDPGELAWSLFDLAQLYADGHAYEKALETYQESLALHQKVENTNGMTWCLSKIGGLELLVWRDAAAARQKFEAGLRLRHWASITLLLAAAAYAQGDTERSLTLLQDVAAEQKLTGYQDLVIGGCYWQGWNFLRQWERTRAAECFAESLNLSRRLHFHPDIWINNLVGLAAAQDSLTASLNLCAQAQALCVQNDLGSEPAEFPAREAYQMILDRARTALSPDAFASAWQAGQAAPLPATPAVAVE